MSSLFSGFNNGGQSKPQTPSLFGGATSGQTSSSLFGSTSAASSGQTGGNLFGTASSQPQQQSSSLFGNMSAPQQTKPAFGSGLQQSQPGMLGATSSSSQPQQSQPTSGTSLFGSTLGASQAQNTQPKPAGSGLFSTSTSQPTSQAQPPAPLGPLAAQPRQTNGSGVQSAYFDNLLERGKKRNKQDEDAQFNELPSLQLGLGDIARKVRILGTEDTPTQSGRLGDTRAHYLLAASGVSTTSALKDLRSFSAQTGTGAIAGGSGAFDTDVEGYLSNLNAQSTLALIAEGLEQSKRDFDTFLEENVQMEWDAQRRRIYEHFGLAKPSDRDARGDTDQTASPAAKSSFGRSSRRSRLGASASGNNMSFGTSGMGKSVIGTGSVRGSGRPAGFSDVSESNGTSGYSMNDRYQRDKQEKYAEKIKQLNLSRLREAPFPLLHNFSEVEKESSSESMPQILDTLQALIDITGEKDDAERFSDPGALQARVFAQDYLDESPNSPKGIAVRKRILNGSRSFLEKQFLNNVEAAIAKNPKEANAGGVPTTINKIRAFIRIKAARKELGSDNTELQTIGDDYCWVLIFYLLRGGLVDEAAQYVRENERAIRSVDRNFPQYISQFAQSSEKRLSGDLQARINAEYQQRSRIAPENSVDPYRMACFKILGRCEVSRRSLENINQSVEDWVWLQFALAREAPRVEEAAGEVFGLEDLKVTITDIGQKHFAQGTSEGGPGAGVFFHLQMLAGMFEQAIAYLYPHNYIAAVHVAIALDYYGLLRVSNLNAPDSDLLSFTTSQKPQINFGRMIGYYTRDFRASKPEAATDYLTLICLNADLPGPSGTSQSALCHEALRELILETREFALLLGDIQSNGQRIKGAIEQRLPLVNLDNEEAFLRTVTKQAASIADDCGRVTDAVLLYHLAGEYDTVMAILNRCLSDAIAVELGQGFGALEPLKPRVEDGQAAGDVSFSIASINDPVDLARKMVDLYNSRSSYHERVAHTNKATCMTLLEMAKMKTLTEMGKYADALDVIRDIGLVPIRTNGNLPAIRNMAQNMNQQPTAISRNSANLLICTLTCCGKQREYLLSSAFDDPTRKAVADELVSTAKDLMIFAGLIRYRLSPQVFDMLARAGQDFGA